MLGIHQLKNLCPDVAHLPMPSCGPMDSRKFFYVLSLPRYMAFTSDALRLVRFPLLSASLFYPQG